MRSCAHSLYRREGSEGMALSAYTNFVRQHGERVVSFDGGNVRQIHYEEMKDNGNTYTAYRLHSIVYSDGKHFTSDICIDGKWFECDSKSLVGGRLHVQSLDRMYSTPSGDNNPLTKRLLVMLHKGYAPVCSLITVARSR